MFGHEMYVYLLKFPIVFKSVGENEIQIKGKRAFLRKIGFRPNFKF